MPVESYGEYELIKKLASGGMASIYLARQKGLEGFEKLLVVKRILPHLAENDEFIKMFLDEARIAARLNHPNIVQIFNLGAQGDSYFIAMEYIHGEDVRRAWKRADAQGKAIPIPLVCRVVMEAAAGLDYAHKKADASGKPLGIVHRDISPQNILVTFEGGVKVVDFGIAKAADQATVTKSGVLKGKYSYMSPEQAAGQKIDRRSDIFALGIVMYELITGTRLFKRLTDIQTLNAVADCEVAPPSEVNARVPKDFDAIVMKALAKNPDDRYPDAAALRAALEDYLLQRKLSASAIQLAAFMKDIYADRLKREAEEGQVVIDDLDKSRNLDEGMKATPSPRGPAKATGSGAKPSRADASDDPDATRADRSGERRERDREREQREAPPIIEPPETSFERERTTGRTESVASITMANPNARFPWVWAVLLGVVGAALGAWLVLRSGGGGFVRVVTDPPGAQVAVDGAPVPDVVTPCTLPKLPGGNHAVTFTKKGFEKLETSVTVPDRGELAIGPFKLREVAPLTPVVVKPPPPRSVSFVVKSTPPGAVASLHGTKIGATPVTVELTVGDKVPVKLELPGYREREEVLTVPEQDGEQSYTLEKLDEPPKKKKSKPKEP
ncbi:MAG: serine/threonine protein kinase [Myxococcaceae bacterium]|nr:serine/threonine protein kinase [Myxococcaceae bacterium]